MLAVGSAAPAEAPQLLELRGQAARWLQEKGVRQWLPGEVSLQQIGQQVDDGQWFVLRRAGTVVVGLRLLEADLPVWGHQQCRLRRRPGGPSLGDVKAGALAALTSPAENVLAGGVASLLEVAVLGLALSAVGNYDGGRARDETASTAGHRQWAGEAL